MACKIFHFKILIWTAIKNWHAATWPVFSKIFGWCSITDLIISVRSSLHVVCRNNKINMEKIIQKDWQSIIICPCKIISSFVSILVSMTWFQTTPRQYIESPSESSLRGLSDTDWSGYVSNDLTSLNDEAELSDRLMYLCMKLATPLTSESRADVKTKACQLCGMFISYFCRHTCEWN